MGFLEVLFQKTKSNMAESEKIYLACVLMQNPYSEPESG